MPAVGRNARALLGVAVALILAAAIWTAIESRYQSCLLTALAPSDAGLATPPGRWSWDEPDPNEQQSGAVAEAVEECPRLPF